MGDFAILAEAAPKKLAFAALRNDAGKMPSIFCEKGMFAAGEGSFDRPGAAICEGVIQGARR